MIKRLIKLANELDSKGLRKEADYVDQIILKIAADEKYKVRDIYTPKAITDAEKKAPFAKGTKPKAYRTFDAVYKDLWKGNKDMPYKEYMKEVKKLNKNLGADLKMKDGEIYKSPSPIASGSGS